MTIDERVEELAAASHCFDVQFRAEAKRILQEVARDQRHQCADALTTLIAKPDVGHIDWHEAHQAVMSAIIK